MPNIKASNTVTMMQLFFCPPSGPFSQVNFRSSKFRTLLYITYLCLFPWPLSWEREEVVLVLDWNFWFVWGHLLNLLLESEGEGNWKVRLHECFNYYGPGLFVTSCT